MIPPSDDPRDLASEARHGGGFILSQDYYNSRGWRSGLEDDPNAAPQMARILSGRGRYGGYPSYLREWREPSWPIYRAAVVGSVSDVDLVEAWRSATSVDGDETTSWEADLARARRFARVFARI